MRVIAIPVKSLSRAKRRLSPVLSPLERAALTLAMLEDTLDAALAMPGWQTWVVSPDEAVLEVAARRGARTVVEAKPPLSAAVRQVEVETEAVEAQALAIVLGDLPLITPAALGEALCTLGSVVAAPTPRGGTNLLLRRPPRAIPARFGPDSFRKHLDSALARGLPVSTVERPELAFDVDEPGDLLRLAGSETPGRSRAACRELDVAARLRVGA